MDRKAQIKAISNKRTFINMTITQNRFFLADFVSIQRNSFLQFLEKGLIEEISKRNPITNSSNSLEIFFYADYYQLSAPKYSPKECILKGKSYSSRLFIPVQLTDRVNRVIKIKWVYLCDLPVMTKRGHFIINGAARVIVNQIIRSPGIYYQTKIYENFKSKWDQNPESSFKRHYADLICQRGTWLRLEVDKDKKIWGQTKKGPKIPIMWLLLAMGLTEKMIFKSMLDPLRMLYNMFDLSLTDKLLEESVNNTESHLFSDTLWDLKKLHGPNSAEYIINNLALLQEVSHKSSVTSAEELNSMLTTDTNKNVEKRLLRQTKKQPPQYIKTPPEAWAKIYTLFHASQNSKSRSNLAQASASTKDQKKSQKQNSVNNIKSNKKKAILKANAPRLSDLGRQFIFNKFMNPRTYDLSKYGRLSFNKKLNLSISPTHTTLTPQDLLAATNHLLKVEYGLKKVDDIDNLKNRRVRTSGELIQLQFAIGLLRLEKSIGEKLNNIPVSAATFGNRYSSKTDLAAGSLNSNLSKSHTKKNSSWRGNIQNVSNQNVTINYLIPNPKAVNSALREFFGTSPLSQFMDQINPLAEITHKRRLSSMGPGGVTRDSATLEIRGIHPSHYGRICPVETPEGKNTGLVNSLTTYARVNKNGYIETPFYKVFKGQVQKKTGMYFFSAEHEENICLGAADLSTSDIAFLDQSDIPVRIQEDFTKISREFVEYAGVSPSQMVSIATSLIPFLEHDDANRALMGSNMQRQAVPIINPERPIVGTGLEARVVCDSGHALEAKTAGVVTYVSSNKVIVYNKPTSNISL